jgi:hypothetical protein
MVPTRRIVSGAAAAVVVTSAIAVIAQGRQEPADGSLAALTAEIRQLRLAVEEGTRSQAQTQALGVYLSAQQSRIMQVAARADAVRKDLDDVAARSREMAARLANLTEVSQQVSDSKERNAMEAEGRMLKRELANVAVQQQQLQNRDDELSQMLQSENVRWTELIARLEQLLKK